MSDGRTSHKAAAFLWLDDLREPPDSGWFWVKTVDEAIAALTMHSFEGASLDHDLGDGVDGLAVVDFMAEHDIWPATVPRVHSMNPVGRQRMERTIQRYCPHA